MQLVYSTPAEAAPVTVGKTSTTPKRHRPPTHAAPGTSNDQCDLTSSKEREPNSTDGSSSSRKISGTSTPNSAQTSASYPASPDSLRYPSCNQQ
eukprot:1770315-Pleurochrysis_carterae.AAC.1